MQNSENKSLMIVDAYSQIFRWFYAMPGSFKLPDGFPINALFGMTKFLFTLEKQFNVDYKAFAFDLGGSVLRLAEHAEYKSNRKPMPEELRQQIPLIQEMIEAFGWTLFFSEGYEADDIIATLVKQYPQTDISIITADKDIAQLVHDPMVKILIPERSSPTFFTQNEAAVLMRFGVEAKQIPDYLALVGDSSDFIPGVNGFGPKTAILLLKEVGTLSAFFENPLLCKNEKIRLKLLPQKDMVDRNLRLIYLNADVPILEEMQLKMIQEPRVDFDRIAELILKYHLKSLRNELFLLARSKNHTFSESVMIQLTEKVTRKSTSKKQEDTEDVLSLFSDDHSDNIKPTKKIKSSSNSCIDEDDLFANFNLKSEV